MPPRKKSDTVALKLRMKEPLRAKIERAAKSSGVSMNIEITNRLSASLENEAATYETFGGVANFRHMRLLGGIIHQVELGTKKSWVDDLHTKDKVRDLADSYFRQIGAEVPPEPSRGLFDMSPMRRDAADAVLKEFIGLARGKQSPKPRRKTRKGRAA